ncbi:calcium-binding protein [Anaerolineales bacterium HSG6]|nr:calcium-binding protein [Anaerolineales bacterium HSG6]
MAIERNDIREERISDEATVDAYGPEEQIMGWYYYLDNKIEPFTGKCIKKIITSPLEPDEQVEIIRMALENVCDKGEMYVLCNWQGRLLGVPLKQIGIVEANEETQEAIEDWHYWVARGYQFF